MSIMRSLERGILRHKLEKNGHRHVGRNMSKYWDAWRKKKGFRR
jgi:hypothetical protein